MKAKFDSYQYIWRFPFVSFFWWQIDGRGKLKDDVAEAWGSGSPRGRQEGALTGQLHGVPDSVPTQSGHYGHVEPGAELEQVWGGVQR